MKYRATLNGESGRSAPAAGNAADIARGMHTGAVTSRWRVQFLGADERMATAVQEDLM